MTAVGKVAATGPAADRVVAVIVNWNSGDDLERCLASLAEQSRPPWRVVVIDNGSVDGSATRATATRPAVELSSLEDNRGFCGGANLGIATATDCHVLVMNPDAWLDPGFLERAVPALGRPGIGFVAGKILRADGRTIDSAGQTLSPVLRKVLERGYGQADRGQFDAPGPVPSVCGAVALYSRDLLARLAPDGRLYDEDFFAFWEDADVGARARRAGLGGWYEPTALAWHRRGGTRERTATLFGRAVQILGRPEWIQYHILKNRWLFLVKNEPWAGLLLRAPVFLLVDGAVLAVTALTRPRLLLRLLTIGPLLRAAWAKRGGVR